MTEWRALLLVLHLLSTLAMAAPLYMLIIVNERARFKVPLNQYTDQYMESIIHRNAVRCFVFQGTMAATGLALVYVTGRPWIALVTDPALLVKVIALLLLVGFLSYIHVSLQPRIEALVNSLAPDKPAPPDIGPRLAKLRIRRKRFSGGCLFLVLTALIMGLRATFSFNIYLALGLIALSGLYAWRVYRKGVAWGWV